MQKPEAETLATLERLSLEPCRGLLNVERHNQYGVEGAVCPNCQGTGRRFWELTGECPCIDSVAWACGMCMNSRNQRQGQHSAKCMRCNDTRVLKEQEALLYGVEAALGRIWGDWSYDYQPSIAIEPHSYGLFSGKGFWEKHRSFDSTSRLQAATQALEAAARC